MGLIDGLPYAASKFLAPCLQTLRLKKPPTFLMGLSSGEFEEFERKHSFDFWEKKCTSEDNKTQSIGVAPKTDTDGKKKILNYSIGSPAQQWSICKRILVRAIRMYCHFHALITKDS